MSLMKLEAQVKFQEERILELEAKVATLMVLLDVDRQPLVKRGPGRPRKEDAGSRAPT